MKGNYHCRYCGCGCADPDRVCNNCTMKRMLIREIKRMLHGVAAARDARRRA